MIVKDTYLLLENIGSGKAGDVFKAKLLKDTEWGKKGETVAIKQYKSWVLEEPRQAHRIYRELSIGLKLDSPHIMKTFDVVKEDLKIYLVMEYLRGETLKDWLEKNSNIPDKKIIQISMEFLNGMKEFHNNDLIHRDLKPENIMVTDRGIVLMDLGVIKEKGATTTITGDKFIGTIKYSAPEYLFGEDYDERIDIFSYGLILYELIFGESLIKQGYWSKMVVESHYNMNIGPKDYLKYPKNFSDNFNLFLWIILNSCLGIPVNRLSCEELLFCFTESIWENIESWDKFEKHKLQFSRSNIIISNFIFIWFFESILGQKFKEMSEFPKVDKTTRFTGFVEKEGNITNLTVISIYIKEIPEAIRYLKNLEHIHFQATKVEQLPDTFGKLKKLKTLYLVGHRLKELPESFGDLESLEFANMLSGTLKVIPSSFSKLRNLKSLYIDIIDGKTADLYGQVKSLISLVSFRGSIKILPPSFQELINLKELVLMRVEIEDFTNISKLKNLEILTIGGNNIKEIPAEINLPKLKKLDLSSNKIETIPASIGNQKNLEILNLSNNPLKELPKEIKNLKHLIELNVGKTAIKELPDILLNLKELNTIHIDFGISYNEIRNSLKERGVNFKLSF